MKIIRNVGVFISLLLLWQLTVLLFRLPPYILPTPMMVLISGWQNFSLIATQTWPTLIETVVGLLLGTAIGAMTALLMLLFKPVRLWFIPLVLISQAIPTFVIAPLLVIWFGYGMASKIVTTMIMLFFPVTSNFYDGLRRTQPGWLDLAQTMNGTRWRTLWVIQIPAALPQFASGLRIATAIAPIGAVVGEWVGSSRGLGFLMLNSNARMQIDLMFAALFMIIILALGLYFLVDHLLHRLIPWEPSQK